MAIEVVSNVESKEHWDNGTLSDIVLIDTVSGVCIQGVGITYLESFNAEGFELFEGDEGYLQDVYDDWLDNVRYGEEGYSIV